MPTFPTPSLLQTQYLAILRNIKPSINTDDQNSDFVIRGKVFTGFLSGAYGDQKKVDNDTYIINARPEALALHGQDLAIEQLPATKSNSAGLELSGDNGTIVAPGDVSIVNVSTGVLYTNTTGGTVLSGVLTVAIEATTPGQIGNVKAPATLQVVSPPAGINTSATLNLDLSNGTDAESTDSYRQRLLNRLQQPPAGGNQNDYRNFAFAADDSIRTALVRRFGRGLGTVDIYVTTGTTDIDTAVTNGISIVRIPSGSLITDVQAYYDQEAPLTDCPVIYAPTEDDQDVSLKYRLVSGITLSSIPSDPTYNPLGLTVENLIKREIGRALYKVPVGGWRIPTFLNGFVVASYIEQSLDIWLSGELDASTGLAIGRIPILADRQVQPLDGSNINKSLSGNKIVKPGVLTLIAGV